MPIPQLHSLRVVVASPNDVQPERDVLPTVIEELNKSVAADRSLRLELTRWETDAYPGFHPEGPQGLIDPILQIEDCDILIGIFWKRFGTPTSDGTTGTKHEFLRAYDAWKQHQRPQIMVYFNQTAFTPKSKAETDQWGQVLAFKENFPEEGLFWEYEGLATFERQVRQHLSQFLRQDSFTTAAQVDAQARSGRGQTSNPLRDSYLNWLITQVQAVPLTGVDPKSIREESRRDLDLAAVYTALMTQRSEFMDERHVRLEHAQFDEERKRLSALAVLNAEARLALLGEPGSGKSTFVNFVALCMAGELLGNPTANLKTLRTPVPTDERERTSEEEDQQPQAWGHGALIPIRVVLREFVARGLAAESQAGTSQRDSLWHFIQAELPETLRDFAQPLQDELLNTGGILLLDGLDEVPEADARRVQVKEVVEHFAAVFPKVRILATSRTYAYQNQDWKLSGFAEAILAPFEQAQIHRFVERWYAFVGQARQLPDSEVQGRAVLLNNAIESNPRLHELATRPLLLTLMASLHAWRGGTLPDQREELYADAVELLLDQWEQQKIRRKADGSYEVIEPSLVEWLAVDQKIIRQFLNQLAFAAHRDQKTLVGTADIAQDTLGSSPK
jgi:hypothetical protein